MTSDYVKSLIDKAYEEKAAFLDLGNCGLTEVPEEIVKLAPWLKGLNFGRWYIQDGKAIDSVNNASINIIGDSNSLLLLLQLSVLKTLYIRSNSIGEKGAKYVSRLNGLTSLDIRNNSISEFSTIEILLRELPALRYFGFSANSILGFPEGLSTDLVSLKNYFAAKEKQPNSRVKLVLIGNTTAGKSSLANFLVKQNFNVKINDRTHGILLWQWKVKEIDLQVNIWDFGGQDYFHATHNIFLNSKTLFLLLHTSFEIHMLSDKAEPDQWLPEQYWLGNIRDISDNESRIWSVRTKKDKEASPEIVSPLKNKYNVTGNFEISIQYAFDAYQSGKTNTDYEFFYKKLIEELNSWSAEMLPSAWIDIRDIWLDIWRKDFLCLEKDRFFSLCEKALEANQTKLSDFRLTKEDMLRHFRFTGEIVMFKEQPGLEEIVFIDPIRLTKELYTTILDKKVKDNRGIFNIEKFSFEKRSEIELYCNVLMAYGLIFKNQQNMYVVPQYLPVCDAENRLLMGYTLQLVIRFPDYMSPDMMSRFISKYANKDSTGEYWKNLVAFDLYNVSTVVKFDKTGNKIFIYISRESSEIVFSICKEIYLFVAARLFDKGQRHYRDLNLGYEDFLTGRTDNTNRDIFQTNADIELSIDNCNFLSVRDIKAGIKPDRENPFSKTFKKLPEILEYIFDAYLIYRKKVCIICSDADSVHRNTLYQHLKTLEQSGKISLINREIQAGGFHPEEVIALFAGIDYVFLLLSADLFAMDEIMNKVNSDLKNGNSDYCLIPVFLRACSYQFTILNLVCENYGLPRSKQFILRNESVHVDTGFREVVDDFEKLLN
ncbi:MAG: hypothetical protein NTW29_17750 [Bacteroidetes bacterium]|nr:hypothetical protein [Bacteroidota bacterium]